MSDNGFGAIKSVKANCFHSKERTSCKKKVKIKKHLLAVSLHR
jgi:hypothetical protein